MAEGQRQQLLVVLIRSLLLLFENQKPKYKLRAAAARPYCSTCSQL